MRDCSQPFHSCDDSVALTKNYRPDDKNIGSCIDDQRDSNCVDAAINLIRGLLRHMS